jgi:uncharacterized protein (TIGR02145 family)
MIFAALFAAVLSTSCGKTEQPGIEPPEVEYDVRLGYGAYNLPVGDARTFVATVSPEGTAVTWDSEDDDVVTVDENGLVTAIAEGTATITAILAEGEKTAECEVTVIPAAANCSLDAPGWGEEGLGETGFRTDKIWTAGSQQWSDVVVAERCRKETFNSGSNPAYKADCRDNEDYGHLFSWAAVYRFQSEICPDGWRVPVKEDFIALDVHFGGTGELTVNVAEYIDEHYLDAEVWGGELSGYCGNNGNTINRELYGGYWAAWQNGLYGGSFYVFQGAVSPQNVDMKYIGFPVRCVRNV